MARNRIIYQSLGLFTGPTGSGTLTQIQRVQSANHTATINRTDVNQFGQLGRIDSVQVSPPTVSLTFDALLVNAINANRLGLVTNGSVSTIANILSGVTDVKNYYIPLAAEGSDLIGTTGAGAFGFGNGFLSNITYEGAVGAFPTESYTVDALNYRIYTESSGDLPTVDQRTGLQITGSGLFFTIPTAVTGTTTSRTALQPGDITVSLTDTLGFSTPDLHVQNFNLAVPIGREDINQLGTRFAFAKVITFPVTVTATFSAVAGDIARGSLADKLCADNAITLTITLKEPDCSGLGATAIRFELRGAKLDSTNFTSAIGSNATVDFNYSTQIGGPQDTNVGLFISGVSA
jgi:hypothetical protein